MTIKLDGYTAFSIYAVVSLEQTISRNNVASVEQNWTFEHVIALFLLFRTVNGILNVIISKMGPNEEDCDGEHYHP